MSKRSRPQPISAPAPESFLPIFDFGGPAPKPKSSAPLPPRKPAAAVSLSKRLAAFTFLNLEDIAEEMDDHRSNPNTSPIDRISPPPSTTSTKSMRFWEFNRSKQQATTTPVTPASLPPMSSKAYATLIGGSAATPSSAKSSTSSFFTPPPSKVMRQAAPSSVKSPSRQAQIVPLQSVQEEENPKSLAVDLVSIFSVSQSDDAETSPYSKTRFSFPMPPSSLPRRGSQSPLDPEMAMSSYHASSPMTSPSSDYSFFSPLFSAGFAHQKSSSEEDAAPISPLDKPKTMPLEKPKPKSTTSGGKKRHSLRPLGSLPPAAPPPRESPPPTPTSPTLSTHSARVAASKRACPSPELDPELSAVESSAESIISVLMGGSNKSSVSLSAGDESEAESIASAVSVLGPMHSHPQPPSQLQTARKRSDVDPVDVWANWGFGAPSRSDSIVTLTQRAYNSGMRGSISTASGPPPPLTPVARGGSVGLGSTTNTERNGSLGSSDVYGDWDQAIDDLFSFSSISRKPSLASIAYAATAEGAASVSTSMHVVESTAFVMDDEMMQKFMESRYLVPTRDAPTPPKRHSTLGGGGSETEGSRSNLSLDQTTSSATPSASATSSARSSLDEERSTHSHHVPLTPVHESANVLPVVAPLSLGKGTRPRPAPIVASQSYPPVNPVRPPRPPRPTRNRTMLSAAQTPELPVLSPLDLTHRPPPAQSVPSESSLFSPSISARSVSPQSPLPQSVFTAALDIDSWPTWSSVDVAFERKRDWRRPSAGAATMISKFSDETVDARPAPKKRRDGVSKTIKKSDRAQTAAAQGQGQNMNPGSSHTSYTFLGLKKKKESSPPRRTAATQQQLPRESVDSARSDSNTVEGSVSRRDGLKRPPLPLELFIRA